MHYHVLYLHGFLSSPFSGKAKAAREYFEGRGLASVTAPDLNCEPDVALSRIAEAVDRAQGPVLLMGSSLGGFFAAHAAASRALPCILINPCLSPWRFAERYLGEQPLYGGRGTFVVEAHFVDRLREMGQAPALTDTPSQIYLSTADEVLDWREAYAHFAAGERIVVPGDDHRLSTFEQHLPTMERFMKQALGNP